MDDKPKDDLMRGSDVADTPRTEVEEVKTDSKPIDELHEATVAVESEASVPITQATPSPVPATTTVTRAPTSIPEPVKTGSSAGIIILQWLTYVFWGWTILSLVWLIYIVFATFMTSMNVSDMVPYAIAATLVLLPISLVCDIFYGRHEPAKKTGAAMVVMVIHAVIFALFGIGMLISAVLTIVQLSIDGGSSGNEFQIVWIVTALISAAIYALTFLRTLNPSPKLHLTKIFPIAMAVIVGLFIVAGFVGPVAQARVTKDDKLIESNIDSVNRAVSDYARTHNKLPESLADTDLDSGSKDIVDRGLVTYKAGEVIVRGKKTPITSSDDKQASAYQVDIKEYRFVLCVEYKKSAGSPDSGIDRYDSEYNTYISSYNHPAGNVCYKLKADMY